VAELRPALSRLCLWQEAMGLSQKGDLAAHPSRLTKLRIITTQRWQTAL